MHMSTLSEQWYSRLYRLVRPEPQELPVRHPFLARLSALLCNPLLDSMKMYVSTQSVLDGIEAHERRFEPSLSVRVARTKLTRAEWTD